MKKQPLKEQPVVQPEKTAADPVNAATERDALRKILGGAVSAKDASDVMDRIETSDKALGYVIASMLTTDEELLKQITELSDDMISALFGVKSTQKYLESYGLKSDVRDVITTEINKLLISRDRKGRKELIEAVKANMSQHDGALERMRNLRLPF